MTPPWAISMPATEASTAAALRLSRGIEVCEADGELWLRGETIDDALQQALRALPCRGRYHIGTANELTPQGARVPTGRLPIGPWTPISAWFEIAAPTAALPGSLSSPKGCVALTLVHADRERPATLLLSDWDSLVAWAHTAPDMRLRPLTFALAANGQVLIRGTPLPPMPGRHLIEDHGIAWPAGMRFEPPVDWAIVRSLLRQNEGDLAIFSPDGRYDSIAAAHLQPVTRSAVRLTEVSRRDR